MFRTKVLYTIYYCNTGLKAGVNQQFWLTGFSPETNNYCNGDA